MAAVGWPFPLRSTPREIQVAMLLPLQGPQARQAEMVRQGVEAAFEQTNRAGGIKGQPVRLVPIENEYHPQRTVDAIGSLAGRDSVVAMTSLLGGRISVPPFRRPHRREYPLWASCTATMHFAGQEPRSSRT